MATYGSKQWFRNSRLFPRDTRALVTNSQHTALASPGVARVSRSNGVDWAIGDPARLCGIERSDLITNVITLLPDCACCKGVRSDEPLPAGTVIS